MLEEGALQDKRPRNYHVVEPSEDETPEEDQKREVLNAFIREIYAASSPKKKKLVQPAAEVPKRPVGGVASLLRK